MLIGYARDSAGLELEPQRHALRQAGCRQVFEDRGCGPRADRPGLAKALASLHAGDTLVVWKLDRLGRDARQLAALATALRQQGVQFRSVIDAIDTTTPAGKAFFDVMASIAAMEHALSAERARAGLAAARQLGRKAGRKPKMNDSKIESARKLLASGVPPREVARSLGVSVPTLYRWLPASSQH